MSDTLDLTKIKLTVAQFAVLISAIAGLAAVEALQTYRIGELEKKMDKYFSASPRAQHEVPSISTVVATGNPSSGRN